MYNIINSNRVGEERQVLRNGLLFLNEGNQYHDSLSHPLNPLCNINEEGFLFEEK